MKRLTILAILILCAAAFAVPQYLTYQGVLRDSSGALVTGTKSMAFGIFNTSTGGTAVYSQAAADISVSNGNYTVQLGPVNSTAIFTATGDRYLEVSVDGTALSPRLKINSVAFAIRAEAATTADTATTATTVSDLAITTGKIADTAVTGAKIAAGTITGSNISSSSTITSQKIIVTQIATTGAGCVGRDTLPQNQSNWQFFNNNITDNSMIFITPITSASSTYEALIAYNPTEADHSFYVGLCKSSAKAPTGGITFNYLIIN